VGGRKWEVSRRPSIREEEDGGEDPNEEDETCERDASVNAEREKLKN